MMGSPCASISTLPHEHRATMRLFGVVGMSLLRPLPPIAIGTDYPHERLIPTRRLLRTPCLRTSENFPSMHSGELTLETELLQQSTQSRDHVPQRFCRLK